MDLPSDLIDLLAEFDAAKVEYLVVGGIAMVLHGRPRFTKDADLWLRDTDDNLRRALAALRAFGAPASAMDALMGAEPLDVVWIGAMPSRIDLMKSVPGGNFGDAWPRRLVLAARMVPIHVVGREDLIALKRASGRPQDLVDVQTLTDE